MNLNYDMKPLGGYAAQFVIFKECVKDILKGYAESMMDKVAIDKETGNPDLDQVATACKNMSVAYAKSKAMLDYYYCCYLGMAEVDREKTESKGTDGNEGADETGK